MTHIEKTVKDIILQQSYEQGTVSVSQELETDREFDSLDTIELVMQIESRLNIRLSDEYLHERLGGDWKKATVQEWIDAVTEKFEANYKGN